MELSEKDQNFTGTKQLSSTLDKEKRAEIFNELKKGRNND
jgi:hypothetical protein